MFVIEPQFWYEIRTTFLKVPPDNIVSLGAEMRRRHGAGVGAGERSRCGLDKRISGVAQSVELLSFPQPASMHLLVSTPLVSTALVITALVSAALVSTGHQ